MKVIPDCLETAAQEHNITVVNITVIPVLSYFNPFQHKKVKFNLKRCRFLTTRTFDCCAQALLSACSTLIGYLCVVL